MPVVLFLYALIKSFLKLEEEWNEKRNKLGLIPEKKKKQLSLDFLSVYLAQYYFYSSFQILKMVFFITNFQANSVKYKN